MLINISIDIDAVDVNVAVSGEFARNHTILYIIDKLLIEELDRNLPRVSREIKRVIKREKNNE